MNLGRELFSLRYSAWTAACKGAATYTGPTRDNTNQRGRDHQLPQVELKSAFGRLTHARIIRRREQREQGIRSLQLPGSGRESSDRDSKSGRVSDREDAL